MSEKPYQSREGQVAAFSSHTSHLVFRQPNEKLGHKIQRQIKQITELTGKKE